MNTMSRHGGFSMIEVLVAVVREHAVDPSYLLTGVYDPSAHRKVVDADAGVIDDVEFAAPGDKGRAAELLAIREAVPAAVNQRVGRARRSPCLLTTVATRYVECASMPAMLMVGLLWVEGAGGFDHLPAYPRCPRGPTRVIGSAETSRRLACDAAVVRVVRDEDGSVLDVGRKTRTIPPALRRALETRDRGCRFPGCGLRFTEAHHIVHWRDGGETSLTNCTLVCRYHHRLLHEEGFSLRVIRGQYVFLDRDGLPVPDRPPRPSGGRDPVGALLRENRRRGVEPTYRTCTPRYRRSADIPLHVVLRAMEAAAGAERGVGRKLDRPAS